MKAIMISDHAKWCALMMKNIKKIKVRKGTALYKATQKLIDEYGYALIYVYCSKDHSLIYTDGTDGKGNYVDYKYYESYKGDKNDIGSGKVIFKFRCYKVEEIENAKHYSGEFMFKTCLWSWEINNYLKGKKGYAIHISNLEIFDKPKELSEFYKVGYLEALENSLKGKPFPISPRYIQNQYLLRKAPQNFCYVEVE